MATEKMTPREMYAEAWLYYLSGNFSLEKIAEMLDINKVTLYTYAGRNKWAKQAREIQKQAGRGLRKNLEERIEAARIEHLNFTLNQLEQTSEAIEGVRIGEGSAALGRDIRGKPRLATVNDKLDLVDMQDKIARRVLKLDEQEKTDPNDLGFKQLVGLGVSIHLHNSEAYTGILSSNNAIPVESQEAVLHDSEGIDMEAGPAMPLSPEVPEDPTAIKLSFI